MVALQNDNADDEKSLQDFISLVELNKCQDVQAILDSDPEMSSRYDSIFHHVLSQEMATLLVRHGADVNQRGIDGMTPLHFAAMELNEPIIPVLLAAGADPNSIDDRGCTPLTYASRLFEGITTCEMIIEAGGHYDIITAASLGDLDGVKRILTQHPRAIEELPSRGWLLANIVTSDNCNESMRLPILKVILESYEWSSEYLMSEASLFSSNHQQHLKQMILDFAASSRN